MIWLIGLMWRFVTRAKETGRHHLNRPDGVRFVGEHIGRRYRSTRDGFISAHDLIRAIRLRELTTPTRPMRWWERDNETPDIRAVVDGLGTWVWNTEGTVGRFMWSNALNDKGQPA